eukprot:GILI01002410.1.p1 GENE.GILI01002410.1~~GILI01002410.1.p1  ORF type:complete len:410 (-),score=160.13 GILI01002410.1:601-1830(-)
MDSQTSVKVPVKLFIGNLPKSSTEAELQPILSEFGTVNEVTVIRNRETSAHKGCAFAKFASLSEADQAISNLHNKRVFPSGTIPMQVKYADGEPERLGLPTNENSSRVADVTKLFVGSMPKSATEDAIRGLFAPYGVVEEIFIMKDPAGQPRGCAFVKMATKEEAIAAIQNLNLKAKLPESERPIEVRLAESKKRNQFYDNRGGRVNNRYGGGFMGGSRPGAPFGQPLASPWVEYLTPEGRPYYYNSVTGTTQWERPIEATPPIPGFGIHGPMGAASSGVGHYRQGPVGANLFIFHVPSEWSENDLLTHFHTFGPIVSARIMVDKESGRSKGFAFVSYETPAAANAAIQAMNGFSVGGKRLKVQLKKGDDGPSGNAPSATAGSPGAPSGASAPGPQSYSNAASGGFRSY